MEHEEKVRITLRTEKVKILCPTNHRSLEELVNGWILNNCMTVHSIQYQMAFDSECGEMFYSVMIHYE